MPSYEAETQWHAGELELQQRLNVPTRDNPTQPLLNAFAANLLIQSPLLALGTLDEDGRPWTTVWGGEPGFSRAIARSIVGIKTTVDREFDPVLETLLCTKADGEVVQEQGQGSMVSGLAIDLETRNRVKLYGRMVAGALQATEKGLGEVQLVVKIEQSLGNCPKYLNKKHILPHTPQPKLLSDALPLNQAAVNLIAKSDLFFISSSNHKLDMDTNHRGGPPGFTRLLSNDSNGVTIVYPEYSGNRLYQTLGNLNSTPQAGLVFPDFGSGDMLYITGRTEILAGKDAANLISHTNLAVKIHVQAARFVSNGLAVRGRAGEFSPYNPPVRYLATENRQAIASDNKQIKATLIDREILTPTIERFRFKIQDPKSTRWKPGQYVALGFEDELDIGYSHMRDDDPKSLNDDYLRTFTVSSQHAAGDGFDQFEITIRKVGVVTDFLFKYNMRDRLEIPLKGFGGEFVIEQSPQEKIAFIAAGVGITPLLAQASSLDFHRLILYWTIREVDVDLIIDTFKRIPGLAQSTNLYVTGDGTKEDRWAEVKASGATVNTRRIAKADLSVEGDVKKWYFCTGTSLRTALLSWLEGQSVVYEDFSY